MIIRHFVRQILSEGADDFDWSSAADKTAKVDWDSSDIQSKLNSSLKNAKTYVTTYDAGYSKKINEHLNRYNTELKGISDVWTYLNKYPNQSNQLKAILADAIKIDVEHAREAKMNQVVPVALVVTCNVLAGSLDGLIANVIGALESASKIAAPYYKSLLGPSSSRSVNEIKNLRYARYLSEADASDNQKRLQSFANAVIPKPLKSITKKVQSGDYEGAAGEAFYTTPASLVGFDKLPTVAQSMLRTNPVTSGAVQGMEMSPADILFNLLFEGVTAYSGPIAIIITTVALAALQTVIYDNIVDAFTSPTLGASQIKSALSGLTDKVADESAKSIRIVASRCKTRPGVMTEIGDTLSKISSTLAAGTLPDNSVYTELFKLLKSTKS